MHYRRYRVWPALLVFGVLLALVGVAPEAVGATGLSVQQNTGANGAKVFVLAGNGFGPGEKVTVTGIQNDGAIANFPDVAADGIGSFNAAVPFNGNVFRIKASGQLTGITAIADVGPVFGTPPGFVPPYPRLGPCAIFDTGFYYNSCPGAYGYGYGGYYPGLVIPQPGYTVPGPVTLAPAPAPAPTANAVAVGQSVSIPAGGFTPGEQVAASITGPNGQVTQIGTAPAAQDGTVTIMVTFPSAGTWTVTATGQTSTKSVVNTFTAQ